jgi:RHS repeat-associated protein
MIRVVVGDNTDRGREEGQAAPNGTTSYDYQYFLGDNLGNTRESFGTKTGKAVQYQRDDYYPFGMEANSYVSSPKNYYLYNKKEQQPEFNENDYGARFYDPVIARWTSVDPKAEKFRRFSPYNYGADNPIRFIGPDGMGVTDIWKYNTDTKELALVKKTNDKFDTFVDQNNKTIFKTNDTKATVAERIKNWGGATPAGSFVKEISDLGNAIRKDKDASTTIMSRAKEEGFSQQSIKNISDVEGMGQRQVINGYVSIVRDLMVGKAAGDSTFSTAKDIMDSPDTYEKARGGTSITEDVHSAFETLKNLPGNTADFFQDIYNKTINGITDGNSGNWRGW